MRRTKGCAYICTMAIMGASLMMSMTAMAQDDDIIAIPYEQEDAWSELAMTNDDEVSTGINIRSAANENSKVIGCLYQGGAAWVINKGEEWTEIYSGGLTGFVKNEYLVYGEDVRGLAQSYGTEGVATTWNEVNLYAAENAGTVVDTVDTGESFILTEDNGHWLQVQSGADSTAYVSAEDVSRVLLLDTAVPTETEASSQESYSGESYSEPEYTDTYEETWTDDTSYEETWTDDTSYEETWTDDTSYEETWTDDTSYSETYETETWTDDTSYTDTYETEDWTGDTGYTETYETDYDVPDEGYYDADTDTYYDGYGNVVDANGGQTEETVYTEAPETEAPQTEAPQTEATVSAGTDDTTLLGALIYCEAGNQSYEGMVAVGAVVMNRVYSSSFPGTISEVIYQSGQFTPASSGALASALANGVPSTCYEAAAAAIAGENPVGGALYFNTGSGKGTKIGDHQFY